MNTRVLDLLIFEETSKLPALRCVVSGSLPVASSVEIGKTFPSGLMLSADWFMDTHTYISGIFAYIYLEGKGRNIRVIFHLEIRTKNVLQ